VVWRHLECIDDTMGSVHCKCSPAHSTCILTRTCHHTDHRVRSRGRALELSQGPELAQGQESGLAAGWAVMVYQRQCLHQCKTKRSRQCTCTPKATAALHSQENCLAIAQSAGNAGRTSSGRLCYSHPNTHAHQSNQKVGTSGSTPRFRPPNEGKGSTVHHHCDLRLIQ
jgi:hypothetical protein